MSDCNVLQRPDPQIEFDRHLAMLSGTVLGGAPIIPESNEFYVAALNYQISEEFRAIAEQMWREQDPATMCCDNLIAYAARRGMHPKPALPAQGYVSITGTIGTAIPPSITFVIGNRDYRVSDPATVPATLTTSPLTIRVAAVEAGSAGNVPVTNQIGRLKVSIPGLSDDVTVSGSKFCGGREAETCEPFRRRVLEREATRPSWRFDQIKAAVLDWPCVTRVCPRGPYCCEDGSCGCGTRPVKFHVLFEDTFPHGVAPANILSEIEDWLFGRPQGLGKGQMPPGLCGKIVPFRAAAVDVRVGGLACATAGQRELVRQRIVDLFARQCPGVDLCQRLIVATIAQVVPDICDVTIVTTSTDPAITMTACGDIQPGCDVLPVIGALTVA